MGNKSTCVMVIGVPRSGTSAVAGVLHAAGVNMGEGHLQKGNHSNPMGYFEDLRWQKINKGITGDKYAHASPDEISDYAQGEYRKLVQQCMVNPLWGMKDPRLCFTAPFIWPILKEFGVTTKCVFVWRRPMASAESLVVHSQKNYKGKYRMTLDEAMANRDAWASGFNRCGAQFKGQFVTVMYENLVHSPVETVTNLVKWVYSATGQPLGEDMIVKAIGMVKPELKHHV